MTHLSRYKKEEFRREQVILILVSRSLIFLIYWKSLNQIDKMNSKLVFAVVIFGAICFSEQGRINVFEIQRKQVFDIAVLRSHKPVVAYFTKPSCGICTKVQGNLEEVAKENNANMNLAIIDVEKYPEMKAQLGITQIPTTRAYYRGKLEGQVKGPIWNNVKNMVTPFLESH